VVLFGEEDHDPSPSKQQRIEFVDGDDVEAPGDFDGTPTTSTPAPRRRATKVFQTGVNHKGADLLVVHPKGTRLPAKDGVFQINPYRFLFREPNPSELGRRLGHGGEVVTAKHMKCLIQFAGNHPNFVSVLALVWFLDGHIAFHQFDNPLFKKLIEMIGGAPFPSSFTFVETHLQILYDWSNSRMLEWVNDMIAKAKVRAPKNEQSPGEAPAE
jgi:hypothetical protein